MTALLSRDGGVNPVSSPGKDALKAARASSGRRTCASVPSPQSAGSARGDGETPTALPAPFTLHSVARGLGLSGQPGAWTWDLLLDRAVVLYWRHRPVNAAARRRGWRCVVGSEPGYKKHLRAGEVPCDRCREAAAVVMQIRRLRARRQVAAA